MADGSMSMKVVAEKAAERLSDRVKAMVMENLPYLWGAMPVVYSKDLERSLNGVPYHQIAAALRALEKEGRIDRQVGADHSGFAIVRPGSERVVSAISKHQQAVLDALKARADEDGLVAVGLNPLSRDTGVAQSTVLGSLDALERKGLIRVEERGNRIDPSVYRIVGIGNAPPPALAPLVARQPTPSAPLPARAPPPPPARQAGKVVRVGPDTTVLVGMSYHRTHADRMPARSVVNMGEPVDGQAIASLMSAAEIAAYNARIRKARKLPEPKATLNGD